jgi:indole-3-glycerol phosphate synthase
MPVTLDQILTSTRGRLADLRDRRAALEREASEAARPPSFAGALRRDSVAVIAEVKRRSPSAGSIREDLDPADRAERYARHGAAAISVLTDEPFFGGTIDDLRAAVARTAVPVLRKDFILDELQIVEARAAGAAAVLLIVRALPQARLTALLGCARGAGLDALVEVHTAAEVDRALEAGATLLGVNSRDLDSFRVDTAAAWAILRRLPRDCVAVAESGMKTAADVEIAAAAGADAVLIGTALSAAADPGALLAGLSAVSRRGR